MNVRDVKYQVDEMIEEGFGSREVPDDFSLFDFLNKDPNAMRTIFIRGPVASGMSYEELNI